MNPYKISLALLLGIGTLASCDDKLEVNNPNQQTTGTFGYTEAELEECVIAAYNHTRMEGSFARVGYGIDMCRGDEVWNASQQWWLPFDNLNTDINNDIQEWVWREWYYTINVCNFILSRTNGDNLSPSMQRIKGQALFLRGISYYTLAGYFFNPAMIDDYSQYSSLDGLYVSNVPVAPYEYQYDRVLDQVEQDFSEAMTLLPSRDMGGQWAQGRATCGAAAGYYARTLMMRHKFNEALTVLKDIIGKKYGTYDLVKNYGDNFREGPAYENNIESLYEVQYLDYGSQGTDDEWTPVNTSSNATQGHAIESICGPSAMGGWADLAASNWLYDLLKSEQTTTGTLDPRLYWTIGTYEPEWNGFEYGNVCYTVPLTADAPIPTNGDHGGLPIAKHTNLRTGLYNSVITGLHGGINLRMMRYSDVLLRAAECINEISGPSAEAIGYINQVRNRAGLADLNYNDFVGNADKLFEQIANVERPKEFGCEFGRGFDLLRWGFFYNEGRLAQLKEHSSFRDTKDATTITQSVSYSDVQNDPANFKCSFDTYAIGHEYLPIRQTTLNNNPNLVGNSANDAKDATMGLDYFKKQEWTVRPVVNL